MRSRILFVAALLSVATLSSSPALRAGTRDEVRTAARLALVDGHRVLHVNGTPYEMGHQHGKLLREEVRRNVRRIWDNPGELGKETAYQLYKAGRDGMHRRLLPHVPKRFLDEIRGVADGAGLPYEQVLGANLFPEAFHCSGMALMGDATHDGSLYHVRILDYMTDAGLQESAVTILARPKVGTPFMNVSFAGFVGSVTGMNAAGVAMGEMGGAGQFHWDGMPMSFLLRDVLERAGDLATARRILADTPRTCEFYYVVSDAKARSAYGVQATPKRIHFVRPGEAFALVDLPVAPARDATTRRVTSGRYEESPFYRRLTGDGGEVVIHTPPKDTVVISGLGRYDAFCRRLQKRFGKVDEKALMEMVRRPVSMRSNLHVAIFHPETGRAWVAVAGTDGSPACDQKYVEIRLPRPEPVAKAPEDG